MAQFRASANKFAAERLDLKIQPEHSTSSASLGVGSDGATHLIKYRTVDHLKCSTSFDFSRPAVGADYLVGIFITPGEEILGAIRAPAALVERLWNQNQSTFRLRWNSLRAADHRIEHIGF